MAGTSERTNEPNERTEQQEPKQARQRMSAEEKERILAANTLDHLCRALAAEAHELAWRCFLLAKRGPTQGSVNALRLTMQRVEWERVKLDAVLARRREEWDTGLYDEAYYRDMRPQPYLALALDPADPTGEKRRVVAITDHTLPMEEEE